MKKDKLPKILKDHANQMYNIALEELNRQQIEHAKRQRKETIK